MERAVHLARTAHDGAENVLTIGHSHDADQSWVSAILAVRLPLYPQARHSTDKSVPNRVGPECPVRRTESGSGDRTAEGCSDHGRAIRSGAALCGSSRDPSRGAKRTVALQDLAKDEWILFAQRVHPVVHEAILDAARREGIAPKYAHDIITLKRRSLGLRARWRSHPHQTHSPWVCPEGVVVKPLSDALLCFQTCVIMRSEDDSRLANEFVRSLLRRYVPQRLPPKPVELSVSPRVVSIKKAAPERS